MARAPTEPVPYYTRCTNWPRQNVGALMHLIEHGRNITRRTFLKHVDREALDMLASELGYCRHPAQGLTMARDFHVSYHRYRALGAQPWVYWFRWSSIEFVFAASATINTLQEVHKFLRS